MAFAVKVPMFPVHTWLPDAHVEAPTGGSVVLAAIMLKLGAYGFLRFSLPIAPDASHYLSPLIIVLSLIAVIYIGLVALVQKDMKKAGRLLVDRPHGLRHPGLLHLQRHGGAGRYRADDLARLRVGRDVPVYRRAVRPHALAPDRRLRRRGQHACRNSRPSSVLFSMANCGLPATSGFVGEFMVILGAVQFNFWIGLLAATALILGAAYSLWMVKRVVFGKIDQQARGRTGRPERPRILDAGRAGHLPSTWACIRRRSPTRCKPRSPTCCSTCAVSKLP
jgi:NADH-quinone oxidoreductase subunit M